jgi:hypothetical protein
MPLRPPPSFSTVNLPAQHGQSTGTTGAAALRLYVAIDLDLIHHDHARARLSKSTTQTAQTTLPNFGVLDLVFGECLANEGSRYTQGSQGIAASQICNATRVRAYVCSRVFKKWNSLIPVDASGALRAGRQLPGPCTWPMHWPTSSKWSWRWMPTCARRRRQGRTAADEHHRAGRLPRRAVLTRAPIGAESVQRNSDVRARDLGHRHHLAALANAMLTQVRQRVIRETEGRRGRKTDPAWAGQRRLLTGYERLRPETFAKMWNSLIDTGDSVRFVAESFFGSAPSRSWINRSVTRTPLRLGDPR